MLYARLHTKLLVIYDFMRFVSLAAFTFMMHLLIHYAIFENKELYHLLHFAVKKTSDGADNVPTGDASERFASREAQKFRFLRE